MLAFLRGPTFYALLLVIAALVNLAGYLLGLWHNDTLFDELVHLFTSFAGLAAIGRYLIVARAIRPSKKLVASLLALTLTLGVAWELFEWLIGIIGDSRDTLIDLVMDLAGGGLAAVLVGSVFRDNLSGRC